MMVAIWFRYILIFEVVFTTSGGKFSKVNILKEVEKHVVSWSKVEWFSDILLIVATLCLIQFRFQNKSRHLG